MVFFLMHVYEKLTFFLSNTRRNPNVEAENVKAWPTYDEQDLGGNLTGCRNVAKIGGGGKIVVDSDQVRSRSWKFWEAFYDTLGTLESNR